MKQHNKININKTKTDKAEFNNNYLKDLEEWSENRNNPGFYTGGQIPPYIKYPKKALGVMILIFGVVQFTVAYYMRESEITAFVLINFIFATIQIAAGMSILLKKNIKTIKKNA